MIAQMRARIPLAFAATVALVAVVSGCGSSSLNLDARRTLDDQGLPPPGPVAVAIIVDRSCDISADLLSKGAAAANAMIDRAAERDGSLAALIEVRNSARQRRDWHTKRFISTSSDSHRQAQDRQAEAQTYESAIAGFFKPISHTPPCRLGSDLVGGLLVAQDLLSNQAPSVFTGGAEVLFVTNGLIYRNNVNFRKLQGFVTRNGQLDSAATARLLARSENGETPQLPNVDVFFPEQLAVDRNLHDRPVAFTRAFWPAYLRMMGARSHILTFG